MNTFGSIAAILAMDLFGLLSSVSEFTVSEGILFICKELKQSTTSGTLVKAMETLAYCAQNRHYHAYFPDCMVDLSRLSIPFEHLHNPDLDTVFLLEKALSIFTHLTSTASFAVLLVKSGVLHSLLDIIINGYEICDKQRIFPMCIKKTQHLDLPEVSLRNTLSLAYHENCRDALLKSNVCLVLLQLLGSLSSTLFNNSDNTNINHISAMESITTLPCLLTSETTFSLYSNRLSSNSMIAIEVLFILCLCQFDGSQLLATHPSASSMIIASWGCDSRIISNNKIGNNGGINDNSTVNGGKKRTEYVLM